MTDDNVVFLAYSSKQTVADSVVLSSCATCRNKTFRVRHDDSEFPMMQCAACGAEIGRIGFAGHKRNGECN